MAILSSCAQHAFPAGKSVFGLLLQAKNAAAALAPRRDRRNRNAMQCRMHATA
jgi:hypothetical protein